MGTDELTELHALLAEVDDLARSVVTTVDAQEDGQRVAVGHFASTWEVFRGIRLLLEQDLAEEARMLWRTLLDDAALLMWFVVHRDELDDLALRFFYTAAVREERIVRAAEAAGFAWAAEMEVERTEELDEVVSAAKARGLVLRELPKTAQLLQDLKQHGRLYYQHVRASQTIHSTPIGLSGRLRPGVDGGPITIPLQADSDIVTQVGVMAAETFVGGLAAACNLLGWDEQRVHDAGDVLTPRLEALFHRVTGQTEPR